MKHLRKQLTIYGNDYKTHDGTCIRDYIHVVDLAKSHIQALRYGMKNATPHGKCETFNIGTGKGTSVLEIVNLFEKINDVKVCYSIGPRRNGDIEKIWASVDKANSVFGMESGLQ